MKIEALITVKDGKMILSDRDRFQNAIRNLPDGIYLMVVSHVYDQRSSNQNRYYWGVVLPAFVKGIEDEWGEKVTLDEAHATLKERFNFEERINHHTGEVLSIVKSTATLDVAEFSTYTNECRLFIQEWFGIEVPDPQ